ncbi:hypothetical protein Hanom_Chr08g00699001 [Helianthus anomalus]
MLICDFYERYLYFLTFFNNISRLTPRPASRLTPREAKGKRLDTRFSLFKPWTKVANLDKTHGLKWQFTLFVNKRTRTRSCSCSFGSFAALLGIEVRLAYILPSETLPNTNSFAVGGIIRLLDTID